MVQDERRRLNFGGRRTSSATTCAILSWSRDAELVGTLIRSCRARVSRTVHPNGRMSSKLAWTSVRSTRVARCADELLSSTEGERAQQEELEKARHKVSKRASVVERGRRSASFKVRFPKEIDLSSLLFALLFAHGLCHATSIESQSGEMQKVRYEGGEQLPMRKEVEEVETSVRYTRDGGGHCSVEYVPRL